MHPEKRLSIKSATVAGIAASALLGLAGVTLNPAPAQAVVYCQYVEYPQGCVARAGVRQHHHDGHRCGQVSPCR